MTTTNFPNGLTSYGAPVNGSFTNGKSIFVKPGTSAGGSDGYTGDAMDQPFATLTKAQAVATANSNDVIYMIASSDTAANTTDYQTTTLLWAKDGVHLRGINSGSLLSQRSRIAAASTATGANVAPLMTVSANNCLVEGIEIISALGSAAAIGALLVSGERNVFRRCHIGGIGHATQDVATNFSLKITGHENLFEDCTIGLDTISRATATYEMYMSGGATRNTFRNCRIISYAGASAFTFLTVPTTGIDRWNLFENCQFINMPTGIASGTTMAQAFSVTGGGSPDGCIILKNCTFSGITASETAASGKVLYYANGTGKMVATAF